MIIPKGKHNNNSMLKIFQTFNQMIKKYFAFKSFYYSSTSPSEPALYLEGDTETSNVLTFRWST